MIEEEYLGEFGLLGFDSVANTIKLDDHNIIKKVSTKKRVLLYERIGDKEQSIKLGENKFILFHYYKLKSPKTQFLEFQVLADLSIYVEIFFQIYFGSKVILKYAQKYIKKPSGYLPLGFLTMPQNDYYSEIKRYSRDDVADIKRCWKKYIIFKENKGALLVLRRLYYSYQRSELEDQILDLMIAYEAMFLNDGNGELSYRLALRVSKFIGHDTRQGSEFVFQLFKKAYNIRSKVVHGSNISPKDLKVMEYDLQLFRIIYYLQDTLRHIIIKYSLEFPHLGFDQLVYKIDREIVT